MKVRAVFKTRAMCDFADAKRSRSKELDGPPEPVANDVFLRTLADFAQEYFPELGLAEFGARG